MGLINFVKTKHVTSTAQIGFEYVALSKQRKDTSLDVLKNCSLQNRIFVPENFSSQEIANGGTKQRPDILLVNELPDPTQIIKNEFWYHLKYLIGESNMQYPQQRSVLVNRHNGN